jgi:hypothetical protein
MGGDLAQNPLAVERKTSIDERLTELAPPSPERVPSAEHSDRRLGDSSKGMATDTSILKREANLGEAVS